MTLKEMRPEGFFGWTTLSISKYIKIYYTLNKTNTVEFNILDREIYTQFSYHIKTSIPLQS